MASTVVHCPGCDARIFLSGLKNGPLAEYREWWLANRPLCNDCKADEAFKEASARAVELGLPALDGTTAQIHLAERTRVPALVNMLLRAERPISKTRPQSEELTAKHERLLDALTWLTNQTDATWWVERKGSTDAMLVDAAIAGIEEAQRPDSNPVLIAAVEQEATIDPANPNGSLAAIRVHDGVDIIGPGIGTDLRNILHGLGFEWAHKAKRWIFPGAGVPVAVAAGVALLDLGFSVRVLNNEVRERMNKRLP